MLICKLLWVVGAVMATEEVIKRLMRWYEVEKEAKKRVAFGYQNENAEEKLDYEWITLYLTYHICTSKYVF